MSPAFTLENMAGDESDRYPKLKELITRYKFSGCSQDEYLEVFDKYPRSSGKKHTLQEIIEACEAFKDQVSDPDFVNDNEYGTYLGKKTAYYIHSTAKESEIPYNDYAPYIFKAYQACFIKEGPSSGQMDIAREICDVLKDFIKNLKGEHLKNLAKTYMLPFHPRKVDIDEDIVGRFYSITQGHIQHVMRHLLNENMEDLQTASEEFLELYLHALKQLSELENDDALQLQYSIARDIVDRFTDDEQRPKLCHLYDKIENPQIFKDHINWISDYMLNENFPKHYQDQKVEQWIKIIQHQMIIDPIKGKEYAQSMVDLAFILLNHGTPVALAIAGDIGRFFRDSDKDGKAFLQYTKISNIEEVTVPLQRKEKYADDKKTYEKYVRAIENTYRYIAMMIAKFQNPKSAMFTLAGLMIKSGVESSTSNAIYVLRDLKSGKDIKWKDEGENIVLLLNEICNAAECLGKDESIDRWLGRHLVELLNFLLDGSKRGKHQKLILPALMNIFIKGLQNRENPVLVTLAEECGGNIDWKIPPITAENIHDINNSVAANFEEEDIDEEQYTFKALMIMGTVKPMNTDAISPDFLDDTIRICRAVEDKCDMEDLNDTTPSVYAQAKLTIMTFAFKNKENIQCVEPFVENIFTWAKESEWEQLRSIACQMGFHAVSEHPSLIEPFMDEVVDMIEELEDTSLFNVLDKILRKSPITIFPVLPKLMKYSQSNNMAVKFTFLSGLLTKISKEHPKEFKEEFVEDLLPVMDGTSEAASILSIFYNISLQNPECLVCALDPLCSMIQQQPTFNNLIGTILGNIALLNKDVATRCIKHMIDVLKTVPVETQNIILEPLRAVAVRYKDAVMPYKKTIEAYKSEPRNTEVCSQIINILEGRSLDKVAGELEGQRNELDNVKNDIVITGQAVNDLEKNVKRQGKDIEHVKEDVIKAEKKVKQVEETVKETVARVDQLESMVLVNSPIWSRSVAGIMKPTADNDWRLMAQRLGYSNDDVRAWATQPDPPLAVLNEWFARNTTSTATKGLIKVLEDINRNDAADIVKEALGSVVNVVRDHDEDEELPSVFISYQWGHQPHVKLLKQHLEKAGFKSWMDTGQMGGGDKLFEKIDAGIRSAKVVLCCVSEKYATSANCTREVNLAVNLWKPIIPLLLEKMSWPPKGSMGPIFGEYLFIRFFQRPAEATNDDRYWPVPKMEELLMQLQIYTQPEKSLVTSEYANWWAPKQETIVIPKLQAGAKSGSTNKVTEGTDEHDAFPEIFISYQWGKQPQVKALYARLTNLGYSCWLDINQMGGGDSLYDKIDKGVRNCKVVISCVTKKYAISTNCRREVSLSDALRKPMIPLLLEKMDWPPEGPMSIPFTQLLFINFYRDEENQMKWVGPKFEELLTKLNELIPNIDPFKAKVMFSVPEKDTDAKPFNAKRQWKKVKHTTMATAGIQSKYCTIL